jgi:uncharacterized protein YdaU (DUF1376 family)
MGKDPAFLFYSKDWITGTADLMPDEKGVYVDLLAHQHQRETLPNDTVRLAKMIGIPHDDFMRIWKTIGVHFDQMDDQLVNRKLQTLMSERSVRARKNRISGTFASVLREFKNNFEPKVISQIRYRFKADEFLDIPDEYLEQEITDWCTKWSTN